MEQEETMDLREFFQVIGKHAGIIALITITAVLVTALFSFFIVDDIYETYTTLMVSKVSEDGQKVDIQYNDILLNQKLVNTYSTIASSNKVIEQVIKNMDIDEKPEDLKEKITVTSIKDTEIIKISVQDKDKQFAADLANGVAQVFMDAVVETMKMDNVQVIDMAKVPDKPVKPRRMLNVTIAAVLGIMIGLLVAFILEYLDNTIKTPEDVEKYLGIPVLGTIPDISE
ncbi:YveK family protein [Xylanivirga thermophila]|jgi:capsular polysaccharide biosynthesis protein|uniref:YveK family protein n=1 Tax=Xylanivirga thermophila TaxID=2496273 RepID=UPI00101C7E54|nr:Wzz/FepE/Etk N-terminal domain-containing protein [Xylanivirga thermophila]